MTDWITTQQRMCACSPESNPLPWAPCPPPGMVGYREFREFAGGLNLPDYAIDNITRKCNLIDTSVDIVPEYIEPSSNEILTISIPVLSFLVVVTAFAGFVYHRRRKSHKMDIKFQYVCQCRWFRNDKKTKKEQHRQSFLYLNEQNKHGNHQVSSKSGKTKQINSSLSCTVTAIVIIEETKPPRSSSIDTKEHYKSPKPSSSDTTEEKSAPESSESDTAELNNSPEPSSNDTAEENSSSESIEGEIREVNISQEPSLIDPTEQRN